jgi:hypothetical protein
MLMTAQKKGENAVREFLVDIIDGMFDSNRSTDCSFVARKLYPVYEFFRSKSVIQTIFSKLMKTTDCQVVSDILLFLELFISKSKKEEVLLWLMDNLKVLSDYCRDIKVEPIVNVCDEPVGLLRVIIFDFFISMIQNASILLERDVDIFQYLEDAHFFETFTHIFLSHRNDVVNSSYVKMIKVMAKEYRMDSLDYIKKNTLLFNVEIMEKMDSTKKIHLQIIKELMAS